jgi:signal transduction histidine kinase
MNVSAASVHTVLIVEDEPIVAKDLQQMLRGVGYDAFAIASSADEAIRRASERCPDLVLMDIRIKGARDGIQTAEILRNQFGVSIVYLTAYADDATIERAARTEPYGYLLKPVKPAELRSVLEIALYKRKVDKSLRDRERWFAAALRAVHDAVVTVDLAGKVSYLNPAAEALLGCSANEVIGKAASEVLALADRESIVPESTKLQGGATSGGSDTAQVMVLRNFAESRRLQRQLELSDRLNSLGTMAAGTAHELNNPLTVIMVNSGMIGEELRQLRAIMNSTPGSEPFRGRMATIETSLGDLQAAASRMVRIVGDLRAFARPKEDGPERIDLRRCIEWSIRATAHEFHHRAQVRTKIAPAPEVIGEASRIEQVLVNLLVNAAHAISPGNADANEVRVALRAAEDGRALMEVSDSGEGIAPDVMQRIFEPFFTTKVPGVGTGLGLPICKGIVNAMGGEISVSSKPGAGTTISVLLNPAPPVERATESDAPLAQATVIHGRILIIDDEVTLLRALRTILEGDGHEVVGVDNAHDALELLARGEAFDLVLSDVMMPMMTGVEFYEQLRAHQPSLASKVVFMTGGAITPKVEEFLNSVLNARLEKPFKIAQLEAAVQHGLRQSAAGDQGARPDPPQAH